MAWHHLGWQPVGFSEIEPFPSAVLAHRFPNVPNFGDMTRHAEWNLGPGSVDLLVGGTPCQSFSVAGLRKGLSDPRGGLMLTYLEIAQRLRPRWIVWENVPGVLSSGSGRDLGAFLGALGELGYGWAYRVLDAQWVRTQRHPRAVPQRRRRVFVVGCLGDPTAAAQVLFERESVCRDSAPRRASREGAAADAEAGVGAGCYWDGSDCYGTLTKQNANGAQRMPDKDNFGAVLQPAWPADVAPTLNQSARGTGAPGYSNQELFAQGAGCLVPQPVAFRKSRRAQSVNDHETWVAAEQANTLNSFDTGERDTHAVAYGMTTYETPKFAEEVQPTLTVPSPTGGGQPPAVACPTLTAHNDPSRSPQSSEVTQQVAAVHAASMTVRRLTPRECERLQGFPDDWTMIPWRKKAAEDCPDGPRYKALGNSMAVNVMAWIGERIDNYERTGNAVRTEG